MKDPLYSIFFNKWPLHASETWPLTKTNLQHLQWNNRASQICSTKPEDVATVRSSEILAKLELKGLGLILRENSAVRTACDIQADGKWGPGRPKLTWKKLTESDCREWKLMTVSSRQLALKKGAPGDQVWDLLCVQLASYLERGPLMGMMPLHLHVNQKSDCDMMIEYINTDISNGGIWS